MEKNQLLSEENIEYLISIGFNQDDGKYSGYFYRENEFNNEVLIPLDEDLFKMEFYEMKDDGDGGYYEDYDKEYSDKGQSLKNFINE